MRSKESLKLEFHMNSLIEVGDHVKLTDGSGLTCELSESDVFIVFAYPELTKSVVILKELVFKVVEAGVTNYVATSVCKKAYIQDIVVEYNGCKFRTCSTFVKYVEL